MESNNALDILAAKKAERDSLDEEMKILKNEARSLLVNDSRLLISKICDVLGMSNLEAVDFIASSVELEFSVKKEVKPSKKRIRLSSEQVTEIIQKLKENVNIQDLCKEYGVSYSKISGIKKEAGLSKLRVLPEEEEEAVEVKKEEKSLDVLSESLNLKKEEPVELKEPVEPDLEKENSSFL